MLKTIRVHITQGGAKGGHKGGAEGGPDPTPRAPQGDPQGKAEGAKDKPEGGKQGAPKGAPTRGRGETTKQKHKVKNTKVGEALSRPLIFKSSELLCTRQWRW